MTQFEKAMKSPKVECDICGGVMHAMYGCGWDNDRIICANRECGAEIVYPTTTEPPAEEYPGHVYVILMRRWGDTEKHFYLAGVYTKFTEALKAAEEEATHRGGKYEYQIFRRLGRWSEKVADTCQKR